MDWFQCCQKTKTSHKRREENRGHFGKNTLTKPFIRKSKQVARQFGRGLGRLYVSAICRVLGRPFVVKRFPRFARRVGAAVVLESLGARISYPVHIEHDIRIQNAAGGRCRNLRIGKHAYIGPQCLFDLAASIVIGDEVALSARTCIVTHADVGQRPLQKQYPRQEGDVTICHGAWIGVNTTVLHGVTIGECTVVGAMSMVNRDLPARAVCFGMPCKIFKMIECAPHIGEKQND